MLKKISIFLLILFFINLISANGLSIINGSGSFFINKTSLDTKIINFKIQNQETFIFYNISFESNPYITFPKIAQLNSGSVADINATISGSNSFNGSLRIKGFYESSLGQNFENYRVDVFFNNGTSRCNFNVVEGDSVTWYNNINDNIVLKNSVSGEAVTTIAPLSSYTINFAFPQQFKYYFSRIGLQFTDVCTVTSLATTGLINNPELDAIINLELKIEYPNTNILLTIPTTSYNLSYNGKAEDILNIKNIGNETAKNIRLDGEWFTFTLNNFDLSPGETKNIGYTISPFVTTTNQTNQTYSKTLTLLGNFNNINQSFNIFINYADLSSVTSQITSLDERIKIYIEVIKSYCAEDRNKNLQMCIDLKPIITGGVITQINSEDELSRELTKKFIEFIDEYNVKSNVDKIFQNETLTQFLLLQDFQNSSVTTSNSINDKINELEDGFTFFIITFFSVLIILIFVFLIFFYRRRNMLREASFYR